MSARPSPAVFAILIGVLVLVAACDLARTTPSAASSSVAASEPATATPTPPATPEASATASAPATSDPSGLPSGFPMACLGLGPADCQRAGDFAIAEIDGGENPVVYVQVGPFGCANGERCPATLDARPEGDVTVEFAGAPAVSIHVRSAGGALSGEQAETFGVVLEPTPAAPLALGPRPLDLGHCGLYSGIDLGGSWWDPVGVIDADHPDAINAATGVLTVNDPDHATYISKGGLSVQLLRRDGAKLLPMCM